MQTWPALRNWVPILMFHEVLPDTATALPPYAITRNGLRAILEDFTRRGYTSGTLHDALAPPRAKRLALTFDDGTADFLEHALPILEEFHFSATLFIVADYVGKERRWSGRGGPPLSPVPLMTADDLRCLAARGFTIGAHTLTHQHLPSIPAAEARAEIAGSRDRLADLLGRPVEWFAYPYVAATAATRALTQAAGYTGAVGGMNQHHERYYLNRLDATVFSVHQLRLRANGLFHLSRQTYRELRYRGN